MEELTNKLIQPYGFDQSSAHLLANLCLNSWLHSSMENISIGIERIMGLCVHFIREIDIPKYRNTRVPSCFLCNETKKLANFHGQKFLSVSQEVYNESHLVCSSK